MDIHVLDHCGNLVDAACLAALAALMAYRKPQVSPRKTAAVCQRGGCGALLRWEGGGSASLAALMAYRKPQVKALANGRDTLAAALPAVPQRFVSI